MKIKQTVFIVTAAVSVMVGGLMYSQVAEAAKCGGVETSIISCSQGNSGQASTTNSGVWGLLLMALNIMTAGVGILAVGGIAYGAALYASSGDKPEQAKQGKDFIKNVVIGLVAYGLMFVILNFLIPGGIFGSGGGTNTSPPPSNGPNRPV